MIRILVDFSSFYYLYDVSMFSFIQSSETLQAANRTQKNGNRRMSHTELIGENRVR